MAVAILTNDQYPPSLRMIWPKNPTSAEVSVAFDQIMQVLMRAERPVHIIVDVTIRPNFPLSITLNGSLRVQRHPRIGTWLVLGGNRTAELIARCLTAAGKNNIVWCKSDEDALSRLQALTNSDFFS